MQGTIDMDDMENIDDIKELEARLYAQIHHETPSNIESDMKCLSPIPSTSYRVVTCTSVINNANDVKLSNRYWNSSQETVQKKYHDKGLTTKINDEKNIDLKENQIIETNEMVLKPFKPYESIIFNTAEQSQDPTSLILSDLPKIKKQPINLNGKYNKNSQKLNQKKVNNKVRNSLKNQQNIDEGIKGITNSEQNNGKVMHEKSGSLNQIRNFNKLKKILKYQKKKIKAKAVRQQKKTQNQIETINLDLTSGSENDDEIIEIPIPSPPTVTIKDTSDEEDNGEKSITHSKSKIKIPGAGKSFVKPKAIKNNEKVTTKNIDNNNSSRCTSPCSVISTDDFIAHDDRSRLLHDKQIATDDDLICDENQTNSTQNSELNISNAKINHTLNTTHRVRSSFVDQDVYCETESDMAESVYDKGNKLITQDTKTNKTSVSSDDIEIVNVSQKKRLRKRRAYSSNKESEPNNDSTDSETNVLNPRITALPFITRGEAVETCKIKRKKSLSQCARVDVNSSDNEFINLLTSISQKKSSNVKNNKNANKIVINLDYHSSNESAKSDADDLTARKIAEEILNKRKKQLKKVTNIETKNNEKDNDLNEVNKIANELEKEFNVIDQIAESKLKKNETFETEENSNTKNFTEEMVYESDSIENESYEEIPKINGTEDISNKQNSVFNVVHSNEKYHIGWNEEMIRFYEKSWGGENFNTNQIRRQMDRKARWTIHPEDRFPKARKYAKIKCHNCSEYGHMQAKCTQPIKPLVCTMCGTIGHREPRCPNTICLRCGKKTRMFTKSCRECYHQNRLVCPLCNICGHGIDLCPDKWRRYHSTINSNVRLNNNVTYNKRKCCCVCAGLGHLAENCKASYNFSEYPLVLSEIKSHQKSYENQKKISNTSSDVITLNLLYTPDDKITFDFSNRSNLTKNHYYGRFLSAVGMFNRNNHIKIPIKQTKRKAEEKLDCQDEKLHETTNDNLVKKKKKTINPFALKFKNSLSNKIPLQNDVLQKSNLNCTEISEDVECTEPTNNISINVTFEDSTISSEHQFKSPNIVPEKLRKENSPENLSNLNDCVEISEADILLKEPLNLDSDSNYSFSEHFENTSTPAKISSTSTPAKISRPMEELPEFIPFSEGTDDEILPSNTVNGISKVFNEQSKSISLTNDPDDYENIFKEYDIPCTAKIYLKKNFSEYLLSPEGNKFLVENSNKFNIKASIDWTRLGNILILEGLRKDQDKFHTKLILSFRTLSHKLDRKEIEKNHQVPRKRLKMIRFLIEGLRSVQNNTNFNDAHPLFNQLKNYEIKNSQTSCKMAEKTRRSLNMILFGKAGLADGKKNLEILVNSLKFLAFNCETDDISDEMRDNINTSWKYIFSSQNHNNYDKIMNTFYDMKRKKELSYLNIDERILAKNGYNFNYNKKEIENILANCNYYYVKNNNNSKQYSEFSELEYQSTDSFNLSNSTSTIINKNLPTLRLDTELILPLNSLNISKNLSFEKFLNEKQTNVRINSNIKNQIINFLNQITEITKDSSIYWSKQSINIINECILIFKNDFVLLQKLQKILLKANKGLLSFEDFKLIQKIYDSSKKDKIL